MAAATALGPADPTRRQAAACAAADPLPGRIRRTASQPDQSEKLIGWIQLAIVIRFGVLYRLAPKTAPMRHRVLARCGRRRSGATSSFTLSASSWPIASAALWLLAGSIVIDMAPLYGLIWSFHLQYAQPAAFYLKAPTLQLCLHLHRAARAALRGALCGAGRRSPRRSAGRYDRLCDAGRSAQRHDHRATMSSI